LPDPSVTVVIPTLAADEALEACLGSLADQAFRDFEVIVVDNSGRSLVQPREGVRIISNSENAGFAAAVNQGIAASQATFIATLNDDAVAHPEWLAALFHAIGERPEIGMCASQVRLAADGRIDSAGMLVCGDGSSKQEGHLEPPDRFGRRRHALLPSGCAALYKREMLDEIGLFDESFFLYCEDTDLGLRARWAAWECVYVPDAVVEHRYSHSSGRASALKAYYVERNRLFLLLKNFPEALLWSAPFYSLARYFWHAVYAWRGQGATAEFGRAGNRPTELPMTVLRAHVALFKNWPRLWKERKRIRRRLTPKQFRQLLSEYSISPRKVAAL
jgi:GT2 family glycosyltransferase